MQASPDGWPALLVCADALLVAVAACRRARCHSCTRSGAVQAGVIGFGLFMFASKVEGMVYGSDLPNGYTVGQACVCSCPVQERQQQVAAAQRAAGVLAAVWRSPLLLPSC